MSSGYDSTTKGSLVLDVAVLLVGGTLVGATASGDKFGLTQGGIDFDPGRTDRQIDFDGARAPIAGMEYPIDYKSVMKGKIITVGDTQIAYLEPGGSTLAGVTTPISCGTLYDPDADYLTDVMAVATRGNGDIFVVHFPVGRVNKWKLDSKDKKETVLDFEIMAYLSDAAAQTSTDGCPYRLITVAA